ncbi:Hypp6096 [Branchiostoma lanceolatum]|uniref:Hypp6096 protein n=1 Tax=Branchiostoma lanceolatum TaxID=7740 RepID=A0A8J9YSC8_BRALA|nr:Hypp6096 [Branchiostoma lanceolatum]
MCSLLLLRGLGACQAVCGVVAVWLGTLEILTAWTPYPGVSTLPIGCGIMFLLVGALGLFLALDDSYAACMTSQTRTCYGDTSTHDWHLHLEIGIICACVVEAGAAGATAILCGCCEIFGCKEKPNIETVAVEETTRNNLCKRMNKCGKDVSITSHFSDTKKLRFPTRPTSRLDRLDKRSLAACQRSNFRPLDVVLPRRPGLESFVGGAESCSNDTLTSTAIQPRVSLEGPGSFQQASVSECASVVDTSAPEAPLPGSIQGSIELTGYDVQTLPVVVDKSTEVDGEEESGSRRPPAFLKPLDSARIPPRLVRNRIDPEHVGSAVSFVSLDGCSGDISPISNSNNITGNGEKRPPVRKPLPLPSVLKTSTVLSTEKSPDFYKLDSLKTHYVPSPDNSKVRDFSCPEGGGVDTLILRRDSLERFEEDVIHSEMMTNSTTDNDTKVRNDTNDVPQTAGTKKDVYVSSGGGARSAGSLQDGRSSKLTMVTEESLIMLDAVDKELDEAETLIESDSRNYTGQHCISTKRAASFDVCKKDDVTDVERELAEAEQLIQRTSENGMKGRPSAACDMDDSMTGGLTPANPTGINDVDEHIEAAETLIQMYEVTEALQKAMSHRNLQALEAAISAVQRAGIEDKVKHEINRANKLLLSLRQLEKLKQEVLKLRQSTVSEIRSYNKPHPAVQTVMTAVYLLLGTREKDTENWQSVQILLSKGGAEGLKRRVSACNVAKIPVAVANRSRQFLGKYSLDEIRDVSAGAATLYLWATGVVQEVRDRAREQRQLNFNTVSSSPIAATNTTK